MCNSAVRLAPNELGMSLFLSTGNLKTTTYYLDATAPKSEKMNEVEITKCRLCLEDTDSSQMFELFPENKDDDLKLYEKVEYCCNVKIRQSPEMPSKICIKCFDVTRIWFNFRQMCVNSQVYLESLCNDRKRPEEFDEDDESAYLNYLLQELQTTDSNSARAKIEDALAENFIYGGGGGDDMVEGVDEDFEEQYEDPYPEDMDGEAEFIEIFDALNSANEGESEEADALEMGVKESKPTKKIMKTNTQRKKTTKDSSNVREKKVKILKRALRPSSPNTYMCSVCGNVYTRKASFTYHMALHSNVKPHECEICGKAFRQVSELRNHMRRHTGEKPYKCNYCDRHFIDRSEKHRHERVHTNTRPYQCKVCGKSFTYSTILKNHSKLHSGEKDFNCLVCEKSFSLQHQLKAHLQTLTHKQKETQFVAAGYEVVYE